MSRQTDTHRKTNRHTHTHTERQRDTERCTETKLGRDRSRKKKWACGSRRTHTVPHKTDTLSLLLLLHTHSFTHTHTHTHTHPPTHSTTHSLTHSLTHSTHTPHFAAHTKDPPIVTCRKPIVSFHSFTHTHKHHHQQPPPPPHHCNTKPHLATATKAARRTRRAMCGDDVMWTRDHGKNLCLQLQSSNKNGI